MARRISSLLLLSALLVLGTLGVGARAPEAQSTTPGAPTIGIASAQSGGALVTYTAPTVTGSSAIASWVVRVTPLRGADLRTEPFERPATVAGPGLLEITGLTNGTVYRLQVAAVNGSGTGAFSALSNAITTAALTVPRLDPTITWVLPSWGGLIAGSSTVGTDTTTSVTVNQLAQRLRTEIGEGPKARIGLSAFASLTMPVWEVSISLNSTAIDMAAVEAALAGSLVAVDAAIANAEAVPVSGNSTAFPIGLSIITAIRERTDGVETGAMAEDLRNAEWYHDQTLATGWTTFSQYARKMRRIKEAYVRTFGRLLAQRMAAHPNILVAVTGDGEMEMSSARFLDIVPPTGQTTAQRSWADYSPFAVAEFRDWLRGTGMYATGQPLAGQAYAFASRYTLDAAPNGDSNGDGNTFNTDFGTSFTSWNLQHFDWSLADSETAGALTGSIPAAPCIDGFFAVGGVCAAGVGFDAPRPNPVTILTNTTPFWQIFRVFRAQMLQRYNRDFARWITEGTALTNPSVGGVPYDRWYSAQVPTDVLFGNPAADGGVRLLTSGSPYWTADIAPYGGMGVTGYNANTGTRGDGGAPVGTPGNSGGYYDRTVVNVAPLVAARSNRWAIVEWNPADPWSRCPNIYRADNLTIRQYRPSLLMPFKVDTSHYRVFDSPLVYALRELMLGAAAYPNAANPSGPQTAPANCPTDSGTDVQPGLTAGPATLGIAQPTGQARGGWLPLLTWATPAPIIAGTALSSTQLNATANLPGTFSYSPVSGVAPASTQTLTATFTPTDADYAITTATVSLQVLASGGTVTGTVTSASTGSGIVGATVTAIFAGGASPLSTTTLAGGAYSLGSMPTGQAFQVYFSASGFVRQGFFGVRCPGMATCAGVVGQSLTPGQTLSNINAALVATGTVTGTVTVAPSGLGRSGVTVFLRHSVFGDVSTTSGTDGSFSFTGVTAGTYDLDVIAPAGFVHASVFTATVAAGAAATVNPTISETGGQISGRVTNASSTNLADVTVGVYDLRGQLVTSTTTGSDGTYTTSGIPAAQYFVKTTANTGGYVNQLYQGIACDGCPVFGGTRVTVTSGVTRSMTAGDTTPVTAYATTPNINFSLASGGIVRGTVVDGTFQAREGITVRILNGSGEAVASGVTDATGAYSVSGLATGRYWARTFNSQRLIDRIWLLSGGADCLGCGLASGNSFVVTAGAIRTGIDFVMVPGGSIAGALTGENGALVGAGVVVFRANNERAEEVFTNGLGEYRTTVGLPAGNYYLRTNNGQGYNDEFFDDNGCIGCAPNSTVAVPVGGTNPTDVTGRNFALIKGGWVTGTVTAAGTTTPLADVRVEIYRSGREVAVATGTTNASGAYRTGVFTGGGTYYALARGVQGYFDQVWKFVPGTGLVGIDCVECVPFLGTGFGVTNGEATADTNFALNTGGRIGGTVTATGGGALQDVRVRVLNSQGREVASATSASDGTYTTAPGLLTGSYFVFTSNSAGYIDEIYDDVTCDGCAVTHGNPVAVTAGATASGINFALASGGRISGTVRDSLSQALPGASVAIFASNGRQVTTAVAGPSGQYVTEITLRPGTYYARATSGGGYVPQVYNLTDCPFCAPLRGTGITVTADTTTPSINFALAGGGSIAGTVTASGGVPLPGVPVEIFNNRNVRIQRVTTDADGRYVTTIGLATGSYYVRTRNESGYVDQIYNGQACLACIPNSAGLAVAVSGAAVTGIDFTMTPAGLISGTVTRASDSAALPNVNVVVYNSLRRVVQVATTTTTGAYTTRGGLPAGDYYVRTVNTLGYIDEVHDNNVCLACDPTVTGNKVTITGTTSRTDINFALAAGGGLSGRVLGAGTPNVPLRGVTVSIYNRAGSVVADVQTDGDGRFSVSGLVGDASYFLRTFNDLGYLDEAHSERTVTGALAITSTNAVAVTAGITSTVADFVLARGGTVRGVVTDENGNPLANMRLVFENTGDSSDTQTVYTDDEGAIIASLRAATYRITVNSAVAGRARFAVTSTVTVSLGGETQVSLSATVCTPPAFSTTALANGKAGTAYSQALSASGGSGTLVYSVYEGQLAPGLSINTSTGAIAGTPTASGTSNFTAGVADGTGCTGTREYAITIAAADPVNATATPSSLRFAAIKNGASGALTSATAAQTVSVTFAGGSPDWAVSSSQTWLELSALGGVGAGSFTASIANPSNVIGASTSLTATITITGSGITNAPLTIPVTLTIDQTNGATVTTPIGQVDTPAQNATGVQGAIGVTGWVLDNVGVTGVKIYRNCLTFENQASCQIVLGNNVVEVGDAAFLAGARTDVEAAFSTYPQNNRAGWGYLMLTSMLPQVTTEQPYGGQGPLTLYAVATDVEGNKKLLGRSSDPASADFTTPTQIAMANATIAKPFGAIDTPGQGQTVSGVLNNFGWALTPDSNTTGGESGDILIATNGSTMTVFIDSLPVALVAYNQCRGSVGNPVPAATFCNDDVANIFGNPTPQAVLTLRTSNPTLFRNLDATRSAIGVYSFNTATLSNGLHTIAWSVSDSAGRNEGIGSRFFNVLNSGADAAISAQCAVGSAECADAVARADAALRQRPAEVRGPAWALGGLAPGVDGVWVRRGFDMSAAWADLPLDEHGERVVEIEEGGRLDLWLGAPVEAGYLVANGTLRDLPVGASVDGARVTWAPPVGYVGVYRLAFIRGSERIDVKISVGSKVQ